MNEKEFILKYTNKISSEGIKRFPDDFISFDEFEELRLPGKTLILGKEFFGKHEVLTVDGNSVTQADDHDTAKFIIYAGRNKPNSIKIPDDKSLIKRANSEYEHYLDSIIKDIEKEYKHTFPSGTNSVSVINEIFKLLNLTRY